MCTKRTGYPKRQTVSARILNAGKCTLANNHYFHNLRDVIALVYFPAFDYLHVSPFSYLSFPFYFVVFGLVISSCLFCFFLISSLFIFFLASHVEALFTIFSSFRTCSLLFIFFLTSLIEALLTIKEINLYLRPLTSGNNRLANPNNKLMT